MHRLRDGDGVDESRDIGEAAAFDRGPRLTVADVGHDDAPPLVTHRDADQRPSVRAEEDVRLIVGPDAVKGDVDRQPVMWVRLPLERQAELVAHSAVRAVAPDDVVDAELVDPLRSSRTRWPCSTNDSAGPMVSSASGDRAWRLAARLSVEGPGITYLAEAAIPRGPTRPTGCGCGNPAWRGCGRRAPRRSARPVSPAARRPGRPQPAPAPDP